MVPEWTWPELLDLEAARVVERPRRRSRKLVRRGRGCPAVQLLQGVELQRPEESGVATASLGRRRVCGGG